MWSKRRCQVIRRVTEDKTMHVDNMVIVVKTI